MRACLEPNISRLVNFHTTFFGTKNKIAWKGNTNPSYSYQEIRLYSGLDSNQVMLIDPRLRKSRVGGIFFLTMCGKKTNFVKNSPGQIWYLVKLTTQSKFKVVDQPKHNLCYFTHSHMNKKRKENNFNTRRLRLYNDFKMHEKPESGPNSGYRLPHFQRGVMEFTGRAWNLQFTRTKRVIQIEEKFKTGMPWKRRKTSRTSSQPTLTKLKKHTWWKTAWVDRTQLESNLRSSELEWRVLNRYPTFDKTTCYFTGKFHRGRITTMGGVGSQNDSIERNTTIARVTNGRNPRTQRTERREI